jgi:23S rRNA (guanosine2251-2'-O)-methyltransferase
VHPVLEWVESRPHEVERVFVARERRAGMGRVLRAAREASIPVRHLPREVLERQLGAGAAHQGIAARVAAAVYADPDAVCRAAAGSERGTIVLVDRVVDPRNLGAIGRACAAAGGNGMLLGPETVGLTPAALKTSAGALARLPVAREPRPAERLRALEALGFSTVALDPRSPEPWHAPDLRGRIAVVAGGEERGARPGVLAACRHRVSIPTSGDVESLNVAVAVGVLLFEAVRQRGPGRS